MKKSQKQLLSVLFHLAVLACMVVVYDAGKLLVDKVKGAVANREKTEDPNNGKGIAKSPTGGTTMEDLMKQKAKREMEKKSGAENGKTGEVKKEEAKDQPKGDGNASAPTGGTTMEDLMKQKAKREMEKKANGQQPQ